MCEEHVREVSGSFKVLNWNVGGAKFLELKLRNSPNRNGEQAREDFQTGLNRALRQLVRSENPDVVTLQEIVAYSENGDPTLAKNVVDPPDGFDYFPVALIDTLRHSHQGKWKKVRKLGEWSNKAFFSQGNAVLIKKQQLRMANNQKILAAPYFPIWSVPDVKQDPNRYRPNPKYQKRQDDGRGCLEVVKLESGLYFGDRNTEPRAALVMHLVLSELAAGNGPPVDLQKPQDVLVVNLHLTTLMMEREGVPQLDEEAAETRSRQMDIVLDGVVSGYNKWRNEGFPIRGKQIRVGRRATRKRHPPIWVIAGDFNFTPESQEYQTMVRRGFIDMMPMMGDSPSHPPTKAKGPGRDPTITLDYVFAGPRFEAIEPADALNAMQRNRVVVNRYTRVSDHYPLCVEVPIKVTEPGP